ncbi:MAG: hypothetical protein MUO39_03140, partial [Steroidobacteraceae bacterium]|nr:hypothetical protein [Steroidobacteraceae bacterium]
MKMETMGRERRSRARSPRLAMRSLLRAALLRNLAGLPGPDGLARPGARPGRRRIGKSNPGGRSLQLLEALAHAVGEDRRVGQHLAAGDRVGIYSYGSGSCAEFYSGTLMPEARAAIAEARIPELL